ncbi:MAG TPA: alpha/beta hydrolase [Bryobacteraceae bacterium]|nr:alpha/beta hydrolase [Bryobacteraceae bacterium]
MKLFALAFLTASIAVTAVGQEVATWSEDVGNQYWIHPDIVYNVANNYANKLDVIYPHAITSSVPAVIYIHGGGWVFGTKEGAVLETLPYLQMGWVAVNVEYRMANVSKAPAAIEDCRCALRWVVQHAKEYHIDPTRIVITGHSAGGHLSLMTGMLTEAAGLDNNCPEEGPEPHVAAIVDWYGITDVADLLAGPNRKTYAAEWLGSSLDRDAIAHRASPLTYLRKDLPPIIIIHGDKDPVVPYSHAVRLHEALEKAGVPNRLVTITGGGHGQFTDEENRRAYSAIREFLAQHGLGPVEQSK